MKYSKVYIVLILETKLFNGSQVYKSQSRLKIVQGGDVSGSTHSACGARGTRGVSAGPAGVRGPAPAWVPRPRGGGLTEVARALHRCS